MADTFRALCAELLAWADKTSAHYYAPPDVLVRARAAMDEPEPEGPTRRQLMMLADDMGMASVGDAADYARAVLARWATPNSAETRRSLGESADGEVAELATAEMVRQLRTKAATEKANRYHYSSKLLTRAADLLERLSPPQPVPVSERLPGPEDCAQWPDEPEETPWCWVFIKGQLGDGSWERRPVTCLTPVRSMYTHWLPAHALPLPGEVEG